jgi:hypothetical protein
MEMTATLIAFALWMALLWFIDQRDNRGPRQALHKQRRRPSGRTSVTEAQEFTYRVYYGPSGHTLPSKQDPWPFREFSRLSEALLWAQCIAKRGSALIAIGRELGAYARRPLAKKSDLVLEEKRVNEEVEGRN